MTDISNRITHNHRLKLITISPESKRPELQTLGVSRVAWVSGLVGSIKIVRTESGFEKAYVQMGWFCRRKDIVVTIPEMFEVE